MYHSNFFSCRISKPTFIFNNYNVDVAVEREVEGDLLLGDMGQVCQSLLVVYSF